MKTFMLVDSLSIIKLECHCLPHFYSLLHCSILIKREISNVKLQIRPIKLFIIITIVIEALDNITKPLIVMKSLRDSA